MTEAMKRFLELNELMEREMQAQRQEAKAAEDELAAQTRPMRERIDKDLLELDKLGVGEIATDVKLDFVGVHNCDTVIALRLNNDGLPAILERAYSYRVPACNTYDVYHTSDGCAPDVLLYLYEHWPEIMASAEEEIMKKIVEKREVECARLEHEIKTRDELLAKIKSALEDE